MTMPLAHAAPAHVAVERDARRLRPSRLYLANAILHALPATRFYSFKRALLNWVGCTAEPGVRVVSSCTIVGNGELHIGKDTFLGHGVFISTAGSSVRIGAEVDVAPRVTIVAGSHEINGAARRRAGRGISRDITIGDRCWIGASSTILAGVNIGEGCVVAAGSVVHRNLPADCLCAGVPAVPKKDLR
jgi:maltose O-acetyltransferase